MHNHPPILNAYEPHHIGTGWHVYDEKHAINGGDPWLGGTVPLTGAQANPLRNKTWASDEKLPWKESVSPPSWTLSDIKRYLMSYWPSKKSLSFLATPSRRLRPPLNSNKSSLATTVPALSSARFVLLCGLWYTTSALSSNTGKAILTQFRYPVTLTFVQFGFVALYCMLCMSPAVRFSRMRMPTRAIVRSTLPMGMFQVGGHMFSSMAISRIPVSTVHTIKVRSLSFVLHWRPRCIFGSSIVVNRRCPRSSR